MLVDSRAMALLRRCRNALISFALLATLLVLLAVTLASATTAAAKPAKRVTVTGKLTMVVVEGSAKGRSANVFYVTQRGRRYRLKVRRGTVVRGRGVKRNQKPATRLAVIRQSTVRVSGRLRGRTITASRVIQVSKSAKKSSFLPARDRTVAVVSYFFPEDGAARYTAADIREQVFTGAASLRGFWREDSNNEIDLVGIRNAANGDVFGPYQIPTTATSGGSCKSGTDGALPEQDAWVADAKAATINANPGLNLDAYDHVIYIGTFGTCGWLRSNAPVGTTTNPAKEVHMYADSPSTITEVATHELGHNLGAFHANKVNCYAGFGWPLIVRVPVSANCTAVEYGDPFSIMGSGGLVHNTGQHTAMFGFFETGVSKTLGAPISADVRLHPRFPALTYWDSNWDRGSQWAVSRCRDASCPGMQAGDDRRYLSLDYRQRNGTFDQNLVAGNVDQGIGVRIGPDPNDSNSWQDSSPGTHNYALVDTTTATPDTTDSVLAVNDWVYDPVANMTITANGLRTDENGKTYMATNFATGVPTASQGTVSVVSTSSTASRLQFTALGGRQNIIKVNFDSGSANYTVSTPHSDGVITAGSGCTAVDQLSVRCPRVSGARSVQAVKLDLGDENDLAYVDPSVTVAATLNGAAGDDWLVGGRGADTLSGGDGSDGLSTGGSTGTDSLSGDGGDDLLWGGTGTETLSGGDGVDILMPGKGGQSTLQGGAGSDTLSYLFRAPGVTVSLDGVANDGESGENDNVGDGVANGVENILGGFGNDNLSGNLAMNRIDGGAGSDTIEGHGADDTLLGGGDTVVDNLYGENSSGTLRGTAGSDTFPQGTSPDGGGTIDGNDGSYDRVEYTERRSNLTVSVGNGTLDDGESGEGDNVRATVEMIKLGYGDDTVRVNSDVGSTPTFNIQGNNGADNLQGGPSSDSIYGGSGDDPVIAGQGGNDNLNGGVGNDQLRGDQPSGVTLIGNAGDDQLSGDGGADSMYGGGGVDTANYSSMTASVIASIEGTANDGLAGEGDNVRTDMENLTGGSANDTLTGGSNVNTISGGLGNDVLTGGDGNDTLNGGDGVDTLHGSNGHDSLNGNSSADTINGNAGNDTLLGGSGADTLNGHDGNDILDGGTEADALNGGIDDDAMVGGTGADVLEGSTGTDTADYTYESGALKITIGDGANDGLSNGGEGDDVRAATENVIGGYGSDRIVGSSAINRLEGRNGADTLIGMGAADTLIGGAGADVVWGDAENNLGGTVVPGADTIQTKDSEIDSVDCGGQPTGTSDSASVDQFLDLLPFLIGPGICEVVTY